MLMYLPTVYDRWERGTAPAARPVQPTMRAAMAVLDREVAGLEWAQEFGGARAVRGDLAYDVSPVEVVLPFDIEAAARAVADLDDDLRQYPGEPPKGGSTRDKKARARLGGALLVWEALTGLPRGEAVNRAREVVS